MSKIKSENKVPGCDRLTRPEEIQELSKYLKEVKEVQEEYVEKEFNNLEAPGITTGKFPKVNLPETIVELDTNNKVESLYDSEYKVPDNKNQSFKNPELSNRVEKITDLRKNELSNSIEKLDGEFKKQNLNNKIEKLEDNRETELEDSLESLTGEFKNPELSDKIEELKSGNFKEPTQLYDSEYSVPGEFKNPELSDKIETLKDTRESSLENKVKELREGEFKEPGLGDFIEKLSDDRDIELSGRIEGLSEGEFKNPELGNRVEILGGEFKDTASLYDSEYQVPDNINQEPTQLYDSEYSIPGELKKPDLSDKINSIPGEIKEPKKLENQVIEKSKTQEDARLDTKYNYFDPESSKLSDYEKIFKVLDDLEKREGTEEYINKLRSLISAYLVNQSIDPDQALTYLDKLKGCFIEYKDSGFEQLPENKGEEAREDGEYHGNQFSIPGPKENLPGEQKNVDLGDDIIPRPWVIGNEARDADLDYDYIDNEDPNKLNPKFDRHGRNKESILPVDSGTARTDDKYYIGDLSSRMGAQEDGTKVEDGIYLRPYYQLPFLSELKNGTAINANIGNTLSSVGVNDMGVTNINSYIRQIAEWVGDLAQGTGDRFGLREMLINETLHLLIGLRRTLEKATYANRDRLPGKVDNGLLGLAGQALNGGVTGLANDAIKSAFNAISARPETDQPINRPISQDKSSLGDKLLGNDIVSSKNTNTIEFHEANNRTNPNYNNGNSLLENIGQNFVNSFWSGGSEGFGRYNFKINYLLGHGVYTTLMELCESNPGSIDSVEGLKTLLKQSPYITTPTKFGTIDFGQYGTMTLDTNSNWEIILEPFCSKTLNGGFSYLPAIQEINTTNFYEHGIVTNYNKWIPFVNFSLQKSRITSKTLGLFDGEISYPISAELTNELRLTLVDDQYKSWRHYFQKCMDVSIYNSQPHTKEYYDSGKTVVKPFRASTYYGDGTKEEREGNITRDNCYIPTAIDKSNICVAFYKNITFRIKLFVMTPQLSTVRKFDLLCVLKDFTEEYEGDIDAPGPDLGVTFSIVGENPELVEEKNFNTKVNLKNIYGQSKTEVLNKYQYKFSKGQTDPIEKIKLI